MDGELQSIIDRIKSIKPVLVEQHHVSGISIFGSYARSEQKPESDLDILVSFSELPSLFEFINIQNYLSDVLDKNVDLVIREDLKPNISPIVLAEKIDIL
jgi:uncharacterized protein